MKNFLFSGETATCMYNSPHETESLPRVLPGKLLTLDAQCRKDRGTSACFKDDRVCSQLFCFDAGSGYCVSYRPAAEGSRCGDNQVRKLLFCSKVFFLKKMTCFPPAIIIFDNSCNFSF